MFCDNLVPLDGKSVMATVRAESAIEFKTDWVFGFDATMGRQLTASRWINLENGWITRFAQHSSSNEK